MWRVIHGYPFPSKRLWWDMKGSKSHVKPYLEAHVASRSHRCCFLWYPWGIQAWPWTTCWDPQNLFDLGMTRYDIQNLGVSSLVYPGIGWAKHFWDEKGRLARLGSAQGAPQWMRRFLGEPELVLDGNQTSIHVPGSDSNYETHLFMNTSKRAQAGC